MKKAKQRYLWFKHYHACWQCGRKATWHYGPGGEADSERRNSCDDCLPRGCDCQIDSDTGLPLLDEKGRELPCAEWDHYPQGRPRFTRELSCLRKRPPGQRRKWYCRTGGNCDRRRWRGELRRWLKQPKDWWRPHPVRRKRNDLTATRILRQTYPLVLAHEFAWQGTSRDGVHA